MIKLTIFSVLAGFAVDCLLGDPPGFPHPVVLMGKGIAACEKGLRKLFPATEKGLYAAGALMVFIMTALSGAAVFGILLLCRNMGKGWYFASAVFINWQMFAAKCLKQEALKVRDSLKAGDLQEARSRISMLVGRDTQALSSEQIAKAAVETVAENTTDGVVSPMFYMFLAGPVGAVMCKAVNTMDSMVGYKNETYLHFGRAAAKLDDLVNYIPARLGALAMIAAAKLSGMDGAGAFRIWKRDRRNHESPNSAQTEAACAGALGIQLGGDARYFGKLKRKPFIGDRLRSAGAEDISESCRLMYGASFICLAVWGAAAFAAAFFLKLA